MYKIVIYNHQQAVGVNMSAFIGMESNLESNPLINRCDTISGAKPTTMEEAYYLVCYRKVEISWNLWAVER